MVVLGSCDLTKGEAAAKKIRAGDRVLVRELDVTDQDEIAGTFGSLHVLVNNAAELADNGPTGGFFRGGRPVPW